MPRPAAGEGGALRLLKGGAIVFQEAGGAFVAEDSVVEDEVRREGGREGRGASSGAVKRSLG